VPAGRPALVIAVLLAALRVAARGLQVAVLVRANPHIGPGRRDAQRPDAFAGGCRGDLPAGGIDVPAAPWRTPAPDAGLEVAAMDQRSTPNGVRRLGCITGFRFDRLQHGGTPTAAQPSVRDKVPAVPGHKADSTGRRNTKR